MPREGWIDDGGKMHAAIAAVGLQPGQPTSREDLANAYAMWLWLTAEFAMTLRSIPGDDLMTKRIAEAANQAITDEIDKIKLEGN